MNNNDAQQPPDFSLEYPLPDDQATVSLGRALAHALDQISGPEARSRGLIFLRGELGAGKTTLSRGLLRYFGYQGAVKSPTYTLVEPYELDAVSVYHFDLYRLSNPEELYYLGFEEYLSSGNICLVEWPEKAGDFLPCCDIDINISINNNKRIAKLMARTPEGCRILPVMPQVS
ncbi:MAG TPA: tRNA (adenosine(37)-N6)-threonylcarbamoyltransferase complex ATPase subunit type 1 TsaE [Pseudomonadales bacterium]